MGGGQVVEEELLGRVAKAGPLSSALKIDFSNT